mgnify:CR=1 FL=1
MAIKQIVTGQKVSAAKEARAKELRREMTPAEGKLWMGLRANRLEGFHFRRQQVIEPYIVDFYCHQAALVIEVDGGVLVTGGEPAGGRGVTRGNGVTDRG